MVDEMEDFNRVFQKDGALRVLRFQDVRKAREDRSRITGDEGSYLVYKIQGTVVSISIDMFAPHAESDIAVGTASHPGEFDNLDLEKEAFIFGSNDYGFFDAVTCSASGVPRRTRFVKITLRGGCQLSRISIVYGKPAPAVEAK
jgi:hypothetical protein